MPAGTLFDWHTHEDHQLAWASAGVLTVLTEGATWVLPPSRALWIPAGLPHETGASGQATMRSVYVPPGLTPVDWAVPTVIAASPLLAEVIGYLEGELTAGGSWEARGPLDPRLVAHFSELVASAASPIDDVRSTAAYRRHALAVMARRALSWAWSDYQRN